MGLIVAKQEFLMNIISSYHISNYSNVYSGLSLCLIDIQRFNENLRGGDANLVDPELFTAALKTAENFQTLMDFTIQVFNATGSPINQDLVSLADRVKGQFLLFINKAERLSNATMDSFD